jgi:organic radical activating enzyme
MDKLTFHSIDVDYNRYDYHIEWIVSDVCQLKCSYCFRKQFPILPESMTRVSDIIQQLNELNTHKSVKVTLTGGEPLLFPYYQLIIDNLDPTIGIELNTNGFLLSDDMDFDRYTLLSVSWHSEYMDGLLKKLPILKRINQLNKLNINIVYNEDNLVIAKTIQDICDAEQLSYSLVLDVYENQVLPVNTDNDNNVNAFVLTYKGNTYTKNVHDLHQAVLRDHCFHRSMCTNNFITINPDYTINYACKIAPISNLSSLVDSNNTMFCKLPVCSDLYQFADTTKVVWQADKITALINATH